MAESTLSKIGRPAKWAVIGAIKGTGETATSIVKATADVLLVTVDGVAQVAVATEKAVAQILTGAVGAATETGSAIVSGTVACPADP